MWPQLLASLFGGGIASVITHALWLKPRQAPSALVNLEDSVIDPMVSGVAQQQLASLATSGKPAPLPSGASLGHAITLAALNTVQAALTGPHTAAIDKRPAQPDLAPPAAASVTKATAPPRPAAPPVIPPVEEEQNGDPNAPAAPDSNL